VFTGDGTITPIAFSLAIGILVDAFVVRLTLVPALMLLFGRAAWWLPRWLRRATPHVDVEGTSLPGRDRVRAAG
jgi:RND superfamily putative drug exporter